MKAQNFISWTSFTCKGPADGPWVLEMHEVHVIHGRSLGSRTNNFSVGEFHVFPKIDEYLLTWGVTMVILGVK